MSYKPMLAEDFIPEKLRFPLGAQPKIDGVRGHNPDGTLLARSMKKHKNIYTTQFYSQPHFIGLDGELAAEIETHPDLCRITTSAVSTIKGNPFTLWHVFDYVTEETKHWSYIRRYAALEQKVIQLQAEWLPNAGHLRIVPMEICTSLEEFNELHEKWEEMGYEGTIIRNLEERHKQGRSTVREMGLLRRKDFVEEEALVIRITEGETNLNVAQTNETGHTFRSSHKENKVPNGQVGSFQAIVLKDIYYKERLLFKKGMEITIATGTLKEPECIYYFQHQEQIVNHMVKFKFFPKGIKDKPRFPQFQSIKAPEDM